MTIFYVMAFALPLSRRAKIDTIYMAGPPSTRTLLSLVSGYD
jgi:hypothetical protein